MPRLLGHAPILLVRDLAPSIAFYRDGLGFADVQQWGDPPDFAIATRDDLRLMLSSVDAAAAGRLVPHWRIRDQTANVHFWTDDALALCDEFTGRGVPLDFGPCVQPWNCRAFGMQDPDGHDVVFGQDLGVAEA